MDDQVSWLLEMTVKPGELDNLKALIKEMVESTRAEPGALNYQWCISDDNTTVHNFDRYSDSAAAKTHLDGFLANYAGRYMAAVDTTRALGVRRSERRGEGDSERLRRGLLRLDRRLHALDSRARRRSGWVVEVRARTRRAEFLFA